MGKKNKPPENLLLVSAQVLQHYLLKRQFLSLLNCLCMFASSQLIIFTWVYFCFLYPFHWSVYLCFQIPHSLAYNKSYSQIIIVLWLCFFFSKQQSSFKWAKALNRYFTKEDMWMANKHMERCSTLLVHREIEIKSTTRYHYTPISMRKQTTDPHTPPQKNTWQYQVWVKMRKKWSCRALPVGV